MLCQERHPPLPPGACSSGMRMGLVLSPGCLVLLSCPFPHPLPLFRPRDEESRAGTGRARAAAACGDPAFSPCGAQSRAGCRGAALAFTWHPLASRAGRTAPPAPSPPASRTVSPLLPPAPFSQGLRGLRQSRCAAPRPPYLPSVPCPGVPGHPQDGSHAFCFSPSPLGCSGAGQRLCAFSRGGRGPPAPAVAGAPPLLPVCCSRPLPVYLRNK